MKIIDTYNEMLKLFQNSSFEFNMDKWQNYAEKIYPQLAEKCIKDSSSYDFEKEVKPIIELAMKNSNTLKIANDSFIYATHGLRERFNNIFSYDIDVDIVFYLGLCNGAGWATNIEDRPSILLGVEKIIELNWYEKNNIAALIYHELGHIWHDKIGKPYNGSDHLSQKSIWQLYREGIAMYCEQILTGDKTYYRQNRDGWLDWCNLNKKALFNEYIRRIDINQSTQDFFGDWNNYQGYSDVGYYLGSELIKDISNKYTLNDLANLKIDNIYKELCKIIK